MKTAISIPTDLFREMEACSRQLKLSRSALFALAVREYLARRRLPPDATAAWNDAIEKGGQPGDQPAARAARRRSKAAIRATVGRRR
jgi:predicted transcriptional regulator